MATCNKDCFNCSLKTCIYDMSGGKVNNIINGKTNGFGSRLAFMINRRKYSQKLLSKNTGISEPTISAYINDLRRPRIDHLVVICNVLHCSADWLLGMEEKK